MEEISRARGKKIINGFLAGGPMGLYGQGSQGPMGCHGQENHQCFLLLGPGEDFQGQGLPGVPKPLMVFLLEPPWVCSGLIRPFKGLIRLLKLLIRPLKGLIRRFKGLIRPFKTL